MIGAVWLREVQSNSSSITFLLERGTCGYNGHCGGGWGDGIWVGGEPEEWLGSGYNIGFGLDFFSWAEANGDGRGDAFHYGFDR
jgi:hypothetical protein